MKAAIFTVFALIGIAYGLECFECNSAVDSSCSDPFSPDSPALLAAFRNECPDKDGMTAFCRKNKMYLEMTGEVRVHRDCAYMERENYTCYQQRADDHVVDVCQCHGNLCNPADSVTLGYQAMFSVLASTVAAVLFTAKF